MKHTIALLAPAVLAWTVGCYDSPCPEGRFPDVTPEGPVMYVDAEYGSDAATGICTDPVNEIWLAVLRLDGPGSVVAAPGTYVGNVVTDADLAIYGYGEAEVFIEGETVGVSARDASSLHMQDLTCRKTEFGVWSSNVARVTLERVSLAGNSRFGAFFDGGEAELSDVWIADNGPGEPGETSGGLQLAGGAQAILEDVEVTGNAGVGLWVIGSILDGGDVTVTDTLFDADGTWARGVEVDPGSEGGIHPEIHLEGARIERFSEAGLVAREATVDLASVDIVDATTCGVGFAGTGMAVTDSTTQLEDVGISGVCAAGIWGDGGSLSASSLVVSGVAAGADDLGVSLRLADMDATVQDSRLEDQIGASVLGRCLSDLQLLDTQISAVAATAGGLGGDGLLVGDSVVTVTGGTVEDVARCGVSLTGASALDATGVTFSAALGDVCLCDVDPDPTWEDAFVAANTPTPGGTPVVDADADGECPGPDPGTCPE